MGELAGAAKKGRKLPAAYAETVSGPFRLCLFPPQEPGQGPGFSGQLPRRQDVYKRQARQGALLGAICAAPSILGHKGLLNGKTAVCFPGFEKDLTGAVPGTEETVRDGNIITSRGAGSAVSFGLKLVEVLYGEKQAEELGKTIQWRR